VIQLTDDVRDKLDIMLPSLSFHQDHTGYLPSPKCHHPLASTKLYCSGSRTRRMRQMPWMPKLMATCMFVTQFIFVIASVPLQFVLT